MISLRQMTMSVKLLGGFALSQNNRPKCHVHGDELQKGIAKSLTGYPVDEILQMDTNFPFNGIYELQGCLPRLDRPDAVKKRYCPSCKKLANEYIKSHMNKRESEG
jgi:hypothetical protein